MRRIPAITNPHGQLSRRIRRRTLMQIGAHRDPQPGARVDVDMRIDAPLTDLLETREPFQQRGTDLRAFPDQDKGLGIAETIDQLIDVLDVIVPDRDLVARQPGETLERPERVEIVIKDRDPYHSLPPGPAACPCTAMPFC